MPTEDEIRAYKTAQYNIAKTKVSATESQRLQRMCKRLDAKYPALDMSKQPVGV